MIKKLQYCFFIFRFLVSNKFLFILSYYILVTLKKIECFYLKIFNVLNINLHSYKLNFDNTEKIY
jgi:hypothetical protein